MLLHEQPFPPEAGGNPEAPDRAVRGRGRERRGREPARRRGHGVAAGRVNPRGLQRARVGRGRGPGIPPIRDWDADLAHLWEDHDDDLEDFPPEHPGPLPAPPNAPPVAPPVPPNAPVAENEHPRNMGPLVGANEICTICLLNNADHGLDGCRHCLNKSALGANV